MQQISNFRLLCKNAFVATKILLSMFKWFLNFFKMKWLRNFLQDAFESKKASAWLGEWPVNHGNDWFSSLDHLAPSPSTLASRPKRNNQLWPLQSHQERLNNQRDDTGEPMGAFILGKHLQNDQWVRFIMFLANFSVFLFLQASLIIQIYPFIRIRSVIHEIWK